MSDLQLQKKSQGNIMIFTIAGKLDAKTAPKLNDELKAALASGHPKLVCDLSGVTYIASAGIGTLKANLVASKKASGDLRLVGLRKEVKDVFDVLGFTRLFTIASDIPSACKGL